MEEEEEEAEAEAEEEEEEAEAAGYRIKSKNPTQRCGKKSCYFGSRRLSQNIKMMRT